MKRLAAVLPTLLLALALTVPAQADVVWSPVDIAGELLVQALPVLLVIAAVVVTVCILVILRRK